MDGIERCIDDEIPFEIPESWEWCRLKLVGITQTGNTPSKTHPEYIGDEIPFITPGDIQNGTVFYDNQSLSMEGKMVARVCPKGSILQVCIGGSIGKAAIANKKVCFNQQINSISPIIICSKYIYAIMQSPYFLKNIKKQAGGTATPIINRGIWDSLLIPIAPISEQKRIIEKQRELFDLMLNSIISGERRSFAMIENEKFERHLRESNLSENTISSYMFAIKQYGQQYDDVTQKKLREYKVWLIENYKPKTVNLRLRALNCYLECIGKEKLRLPFVRVQQKSYLENVISEADYEYFKSCLKKDEEMFWYFVIRFLAATGARVSELIQIKAEHVKLGHLDLYSKGGKLRRIYIPKELQNEALSWLAEKQQESGFIFLNKYGERITTRGISGQLKKLAARYNINPAVVYPHSFRHRFAKSFLERCNDIAFLADLMGHESIETTRIYLRKTSTEQREIVDTIINW